MTTRAQRHVRVNTGLLAAAEQRALVRIAERLPPWVNSDHLTLLALAAMAGAGAAFWAAASWRPALAVVVVALVLNWFGDSLDGTLARVRGCPRPRYGYYVDHVLDLVGVSLLVGGLALSGFVSPLMALMVLVAYLLASAEVFLATAAHGTFRMAFAGVGPTELRIVLAIGALTAWRTPWVAPFGIGPVLLFDLGGLIAACGLAVAFFTSVARTTVELYRAEPLPSPKPRSPGIRSG